MSPSTLPAVGVVAPDSRPTVLIVDDEPEITDLYAQWLADEYEVRTAAGGSEALDLLDGDVDAILLDRRMPGTCGDELLAEIRETGSDCPVAMVTAVEPGEDVLEMAFDDYLVKPVFEADLRETVERLLARRAYDAELREYYALVRKRALLDPDNPVYATLTERIEALEDQLDETLEAFGGEDYDALFADLADENRERADD